MCNKSNVNGAVRGKERIEMNIGESYHKLHEGELDACIEKKRVHSPHI